MTMHPSDRHYRNMTVRLADLTVIEDVITGVTFENCVIVGPAVVVLMGNGSLINSNVDADPDAIFWDISEGRERVVGAIGLLDCHIVGCRLERIGFAVNQEGRAKFQRGFGLSD